MIPIMLDVGLKKPIAIEAVEIELCEDSRLNQCVSLEKSNQGGAASLAHVQHNNLPLGIPFSRSNLTMDRWFQYIEEFVAYEIKEKASEMWFDYDSRLMPRLLGVICDFYIANVEANENVWQVSHTQIVFTKCH
jgi:hypothetical protein